MTTNYSPWLRTAPRSATAGAAGGHGATPGRPLLVCLAYAGRGASVFADWSGLVGDVADVCAVQLPAREDRLSDEPVTDVESLRAQLLPALLPLLDRPFVLFGHCMGALLAADLATTLHARHGVQPDALVISGAAPPWRQEPLGDLRSLTDGEFVRGLRRAGALTPRQLAEPAVLALMLPAIRADYLLFESTRRELAEPSEPPLSCPVALFAGDADAAIEPEKVREWGALTSAAAPLRVFRGDHFFLESAAGDVAAAVADVVATARRSAA